ncbi:MAG: LysM peptidoglycan-binding domain-containing protein [Bryobacterales bacterium]|nr:LysM peptidoglycan-binding domain-containing protein [Bryobacterales bacterium]
MSSATSASPSCPATKGAKSGEHHQAARRPGGEPEGRVRRRLGPSVRLGGLDCSQAEGCFARRQRQAASRRVNDDGLQVKPKPEAPPEPEFTFYTIVSGDSLSKIATKYYGDALKWNTLFEANREVIQNPDLIYPGQVIRVPKEPS